MMTIDFAFNDDQVQLRDKVRRFLQVTSDVHDVRRIMATPGGVDRGAWQGMAHELGLLSLFVPTSCGGGGGSAVDMAVVFEELGRALYCGPYLSTVALGAGLLGLMATDPIARDYLTAIADGALIATVAMADVHGRWDDGEPSVLAENVAGGGWRVCGTTQFVMDAGIADVVLFVAQTATGLSVFAVDATATGLFVEPMETLDLTREMATVRLDWAPARMIGEPGAAAPVMRAVRELAATMLAAEQAGGAGRLLEMTVAYVQDRIQFGRPVGSFQAVKHKCAEMLLKVESARSAAYYAAAAMAGAQAPPGVASLAKAYCSEAFVEVASDAIQLHGGIGFTWEHPAQLYYRRAWSSCYLFGDPSYHRELLARAIGI